MKAIVKAVVALTLALAGSVFGAMLTTDYTTMRKNGVSYVDALGGGLGAVWDMAFGVAASAWFLIPLAAAALIYTTVKVTLWTTKPKADPLVSLGVRMNAFVDLAQHNQRFRKFSFYNDTMRVCHEMEAFIVRVAGHGIPVPAAQSNEAEAWIDLCCDYLTAVGPFLRGGDDVHAMAVAKGFADRNPPEL
jgi:hypothetical protein